MPEKLITKLWAAVRLAQPQSVPRDGWFQLFPELNNQGRPETVLELLNSSRLVIPFLQRENEGVLLLVRENIDWVAIGAGVEPHLIFPPDRHAAFQERVEISFIDEQRIEADIRWGDFATNVRLSDYLNSSDAFIAAEASFGTLMVNKRRIRQVRIVNASDVSNAVEM